MNFFETGFTKPREEKNPEQTIEKKYSAQTNIKDIDINVNWYADMQEYNIYFPQIELGHDHQVFDQVIRLTDNEENAKRVFAYAVSVAEQGVDVYEVYKQVEEFAHDLEDED